MRSFLSRSLMAILILGGMPNPANADIAVIVHRDNPVQTLTPREVSDLYLGRARTFNSSDGKAAIPASIRELPPDSPLRQSFFRALNGMDIRQVNAYWARLRFSGEVLPPLTLPDSHAVLEAVSHEQNAIGYVDAASVSTSVKVVLRLKE